MVHISCKRGLDLPFPMSISKPEQKIPPEEVAIDLTFLSPMRLKMLVSEGDSVQIGSAIATEKENSDRVFLSHASGIVKEVRRGMKRTPTSVIITLDHKDNEIALPPINPKTASKEKILSRFKEGGLFAYIRQRPFDLIAHPNFLPKSIFIKALESAPLALSSRLHVEGFEHFFEAGILALDKITPGCVHVVRHKSCSFPPFVKPTPAHSHTASGPHPVCSPSLHIEKIDPLKSVNEVIWTLNAKDVVSIGKRVLEGTCHRQSLVFTHMPDEQKGNLFRTCLGYPIKSLVQNPKGRLVAGDALMGVAVSLDDFMPQNASTLFVLPEDLSRQSMHFFRAKTKSFSAFRAYLKSKKPNFTSSMHGEERAFIDGSIYDKVMPLKIPTMPLIKAVLAEDFEKAIDLGLLEVASEDFALPTFVCPSKIEMVTIIRSGLTKLAEQLL